MKILYSFLHRCTKLGIIHIKNYSIFNHQDWCFARFRGTKFRVPSSRPLARLHYKDEQQILRNILAQEQISEYLQQPTIPWQDVRTAIVKHPDICVDESTVNSCVLKSCLNLNLLDIGVSFYKDILSKGGMLSLPELSIILKLFAENRDRIPEYEDIVRSLFDVYKPHIKEIQSVQGISCAVFSSVKDLWKEMVKICDRSIISGKSIVIGKAFDYNAPDVGWELLHQEPMQFKLIVLESYFNYCIRLAKANRFSVSLINDLVNFCQKYVMVIPYKNLFSALSSLISILNKNPNQKYKWIVNESKINLNGVCSCCRLKLNEVRVSKEEYDKLRFHMLKDTLISNIDLKSCLKDLDKFKLFLSQCSSYNFVLDGLNLIYCDYRVKDTEIIKLIMEYAESENKKVLFIGKKHIQGLPVFEYIQSRCQVFLTENMSDDDIFVIYAALHGGLGTYFLSRDFYRSYHKFFNDNEVKRSFLKWKLTHMCSQVHHSDRLTVYRAFHSFLPQSTNLPNELCWHLSCATNSTPNNYWDKDLSWICLKAVPLEKLSNSLRHSQFKKKLNCSS